ncbi:MAG: HlyD family efflux transporter periplasmic adaptor subunit [Proteobacteria bacterium]|nr:HlyD family efflux transporter periplasmic adaptor subunit [Pseudomonadota bacterium]
MNRWSWRDVALVAAVLLFAGCSGSEEAGNAEGTVPQAQPAPTVAAAPVASGPTGARTFQAEPAARTVTLTGFTRARTSLTLVSEEEGRVVEIPVDLGDAIGEDGVFARLDTTFIELDLAQNRTEQARLAGDVSFYSKELKRYDSLVKNDNAAQATLDSHARDHGAANQQLRGLRLEGQRLEERLKRFTFTATPGWRVSQRMIEPGQWITRGQAVGEVGNYNELLVPFALSLPELDGLKKMGETVILALPELHATVPARLLREAPGFDPESRKINVDLVILEGDFPFRGGIRTELTIDLPDPGGAVTVPASALVRAYEDYFLVKPDGIRVKVLLLGSGSDGSRRVSAEEVSPGDVFLLLPESSG